MSAPEHPVVQVSWFDAMSFAAWVSDKVGIVCRVPTKEEWILAARPAALADQVCTFPWGSDFCDLDKRMNFGTAELTDHTWIHEQYADGYALTSPVQAFPPNERGLYDMVGNVWVWNYTNAAAYEQRPVAERTATVPRLAVLGVERNARISMQGGCFLARVTHTTLWSKMSHPALDGAVDIGFAARGRAGGRRVVSGGTWPPCVSPLRRGDVDSRLRGNDGREAGMTGGQPGACD